MARQHLKLLVLNILVALLSLLFIPFKWLLSKSVKFIDKELDSMLHSSQVSLAVIDPSYAFVNLIAAITIQGVLRPERVRSLFLELSFKDSVNGELFFKRLGFTWKFLWGYPFWRRTDFQVENHIRLYDYKSESLTLPHPCTEKELEGVLGELAHAPWDPERSPWEILLVNDYQKAAEDVESGELPQTLFLLRTDHVLMDGFSVLYFLEKLFNVRIVTPKPRVRLEPPRWARPLYAIKSVWSYASICVAASRPNFGTGMSMPRRAVCSLSSGTPLSVIKGISSHFGVSFTAVVFTAMMGAIQRMQEEEGIQVSDYLTSTMVLFKPDHPPGLGNHFYLSLIPWTVKANNPFERLESIEKLVRAKIKSLDFLGFETIYQNVFQRFPSNLRNLLIDVSIPGESMVTGNFPTIKEPVLLDGLEALDMVGCTSILPCEGFGVGMSGCQGKQRLAFLYDSRLFTTEEHVMSLGQLFDEQMNVLWSGTLE